MKEQEENKLPQDKDRHLDIPSESNREKHINFLDLEADNRGSANDAGNEGKDKELEERQKQWKEGIEEGKKARNSE